MVRLWIAGLSCLIALASGSSAECAADDDDAACLMQTQPAIVTDHAIFRASLARAVASLDAEDKLAAVGAGGAWVRSSKSQAEHFAWERNVSDPYRHKYGFYLHSYAEPFAMINLMRSIRKVYPTEPVYVMSDGGHKFDGICKEIGNCNFQWRMPANDRWNPMPFLTRFKEGARWLQSKYVIMLEPDNTVVDHIKLEPADDAGGLHDTNPAFGERIRNFVEDEGRKRTSNPNFELKWWRFGFCGGSYFRTAAILDAFNPEKVDWHMLRSLDGKRVWSSDVAMPLVLAMNGYNYQPWQELTQKRTENWFGRPENVAFEHHGRDEKDKYVKGIMSVHDRALYEETPPGAAISCQGCVWASEAQCKKAKKCPITGHDMGPNW